MTIKEAVMENPFEYYKWVKDDLLFAMAINGEQERVFVGTRAGILKHLQENGELVGDNERINQYIEKYHFVRVGDTVKETSLQRAWRKLCLIIKTWAFYNWLRAIKEYKKDKERENTVQIPFVCEKTYKTGSFLLEFRKDQEKEWKSVIWKLSLGLQAGVKRGQLADEAKEFLLEKWNEDDPVAKYAAISIWRAFCMEKDKARFEEYAKGLVCAFWQNIDAMPNLTAERITIDDPILRLPEGWEIEEDEIKLWTVVGTDLGLVVLDRSFYPLKLYYRVRMNEYGIKYRCCRICGKIFPTTTKKKATCDDIDCRRKSQAKNKEIYEDKNKGNALENAAKRTTSAWRRRIEKAEKIADFSPERLAMMKEQFEKFKVECREKKKVANKARQERLSKGKETETAKEEEFLSWLWKQEHEASLCMGEFEDIHEY